MEMGEQIKGLDIHSLIAEPLITACKAQSILASSTDKLIQEVGLKDLEDGRSKGKTTSFSFQRELLGENGESIGTEVVNMGHSVDR